MNIEYLLRLSPVFHAPWLLVHPFNGYRNTRGGAFLSFFQSPYSIRISTAFTHVPVIETSGLCVVYAWGYLGHPVVLKAGFFLVTTTSSWSSSDFTPSMQRCRPLSGVLTPRRLGSQLQVEVVEEKKPYTSTRKVGMQWHVPPWLAACQWVC